MAAVLTSHSITHGSIGEHPRNSNGYVVILPLKLSSISLAGVAYIGRPKQLVLKLIGKKLVPPLHGNDGLENPENPGGPGFI